METALLFTFPLDSRWIPEAAGPRRADGSSSEGHYPGGRGGVQGQLILKDTDWLL